MTRLDLLRECKTFSNIYQMQCDAIFQPIEINVSGNDKYCANSEHFKVLVMVDFIRKRGK